MEALTKGFDNGPLFSKLNLMVEVGEKVAVLGANGIGKTTLLKTLVGDAQPDSGTVKWSENARIGYYAQDHEYEFDDTLTVFDWMSQWKQEKTTSRRCAACWAVYCSARTTSRRK